MIFASHRKCSCIALCSNCAWHIFIRVDAANEVAYELIAEPVQEPRAEESQKVTVEHAPEEIVNPEHNHNLNYSMFI